MARSCAPVPVAPVLVGSGPGVKLAEQISSGPGKQPVGFCSSGGEAYSDVAAGRKNAPVAEGALTVTVPPVTTEDSTSYPATVH